MLEKILEEIIEQLKAEGCIIDNDAGNRAEEIIRKHMNDGWIPVEERLPNEEEFIKSYCRNKYAAEFIVMIKGATKPTTLYYRNGTWADEENNHYNVIA